MIERSRTAVTRWRAGAVAACIAVLIALTAQPSAALVLPALPNMAAAAATSGDRRIDALADRVDQLEDNVHETRTITEIVLGPLAILVAILAAGGVLGIVFSVRDQRRVSQLHELTVGGEVSSQRRAEQSYASFLEQSQTTLALVNDTLLLAKEATDRAAHSTELKAQARIDTLEERAEQLMLEMFSTGEFELIINDTGRRSELHAVAEELRALAGLSLASHRRLHKGPRRRRLDRRQPASPRQATAVRAGGLLAGVTWPVSDCVRVSAIPAQVSAGGPHTRRTVDRSVSVCLTVGFKARPRCEQGPRAGGALCGGPGL